MNAFDLLMTDHQKVSDIFDRLEMDDGGVAGSREQLFRQLKHELDVHAHVEETIFYPALKGAEGTRELVAEAYAEHAAVKELLAELEATAPGEGGWDDLLAELRENVEHHVEEEEGDLFEQARLVLTGEQAEELGERMNREKQHRLTATA
jgi:iron-sulfur cluster repair protein YtfE (RIC family)